jgi:hypothetical protein
MKLHNPSAIGKELDKIGADFEFMRFLLIWNGLIIQPKLVDFTTTKLSESYQRKIKRQVKKNYGSQWKAYWENIKKTWKEQNRMVLERRLFKMEPLPPNPPNRPRNYRLWSAVYDLRNYMIKLTTEPKMSLIEEFLISEGLWAFGSLYKEWSRRKKWFKGNDYRVPIDDHLRWYEVNKKKIAEAIRTGVPMWQQFQRVNEKEPSKPKRGRPKKGESKKLN